MTTGLKTTLSKSLRKESAKVQDRFARAKEATKKSEPANRPTVIRPETSAPDAVSSALHEKQREGHEKLLKHHGSDAREEPTITETKLTKPSAKPKAATKIRTSFSILESEYVLLERLQRAGLRRGKQTSKSEIVRAALRALKECPPSDFGRHLDDLP